MVTSSTRPSFCIADRVFLGHQVSFRVSRQIVVEEDVLIAAGCYITVSIWMSTHSIHNFGRKGVASIRGGH